MEISRIHINIFNCYQLTSIYFLHFYLNYHQILIPMHTFCLNTCFYITGSRMNKAMVIILVACRYFNDLFSSILLHVRIWNMCCSHAENRKVICMVFYDMIWILNLRCHLIFGLSTSLVRGRSIFCFFNNRLESHLESQIP